MEIGGISAGITLERLGNEVKDAPGKSAVRRDKSTVQVGYRLTASAVIVNKFPRAVLRRFATFSPSRVYLLRSWNLDGARRNELGGSGDTISCEGNPTEFIIAP